MSNDAREKYQGSNDSCSVFEIEMLFQFVLVWVFLQRTMVTTINNQKRLFCMTDNWLLCY